MRRVRKLIAITAVMLGGAVLIPGIGMQSAWAAAPPTQICDGVYCLNAWGGGPWIKANPAGTANNYFYVQQLTGMCNHGYSTTDCPLSPPISGMSSTSGLFIYQIRYGNEYAGSTDNCLADDGAKNGQTAFGYCNTLSGSGGSYGTILLSWHGGCPSGFNYGLSREWTDYYGVPTGISIDDLAGHGSPVYDAATSTEMSCLEQLGQSPKP